MILYSWKGDHTVLGFTTTYAISTYHNVIESCSGEVYSIQHYVIKFVSDLWQVGGFLRLIWFPPPIKTDIHDITEIIGVKYHNSYSWKITHFDLNNSPSLKRMSIALSRGVYSHTYQNLLSNIDSMSASSKGMIIIKLVDNNEMLINSFKVMFESPQTIIVSQYVDKRYIQFCSNS